MQTRRSVPTRICLSVYAPFANMVQNAAVHSTQKDRSEARSGEFAAYARLPLDERFYASEVGDENIAFMKAQTGIQGNEEIKQHIMKIQAYAYQVRFQDIAHLLTILDHGPRVKVYPYPFIRWFWFVE